MEKKVYFCGIDWNWEVGETEAPAYSSVEELKERHPCWESCGIVEVELSGAPVKWLVPYEPGKGAVPFDEAQQAEAKERLAEIEQLIDSDPPLDSPLGKHLKKLAMAQELYEKRMLTHTLSPLSKRGDLEKPDGEQT